MLKRTILVALCSIATFFLYLSFQNSSNNAIVDELKDKALQFESDEEYDSAAIYFVKARELADRLKLDSGRHQVLESEITFWINRADKENSEIKKQLELLWATYNADATFRVNYFEAKSIFFLRISEKDSFDFYLNKTIRELKNHKDSQYEISYYAYVAQQLLAMDELFEAKKYVELAEKSIEYHKPKNKNEIKDYYFVATEFYTRYGDCEKALEPTLGSYEFIKKERPDDYIELSNILNNLGVIYECLEEFEYAEKYYNESLKLSLKFDKNSGIAISYNNLGKFYVNVLDSKMQAIEAFNTSLLYSKDNSQIDDQNKIISLCLN
jgi:tetratricopeptide (TPR) repeat protein